MRCSVLPINSNFTRKATVCLHPFIPICADRVTVRMVITMVIVNPDLRISKNTGKKIYSVVIPTEREDILEINEIIYKLLQEVNDGSANTDEKLSRLISRSIIRELYEKRLIMNSNEPRYNENLLGKFNGEFPLRVLTIELTNSCNLNCIHCFGRFGQPSQKKMYSFEDIVKIKHELDILHTMEVRLSGGECFLNPDFERIAIYFLENGFRVGIYTNGFMTEKIIQFAEATKKYHFYMGISLDGPEHVHNNIRGCRTAFENTMATLTKLREYPNIEVFIETVVMRQNVDNIVSARQLVMEHFPEYEMKISVATPVDNSDFSFDYSEIPKLKEQYPELFSEYFSAKKHSLFQEKRHRCQGGVSGAALTVEGVLKICPFAEEDVFILGNIVGSSLSTVWNNPNDSIKEFRREYIKKMQQCKKCKEKRNCGTRNCRVEALRLTGDCKNANPYTCMAVKNQYSE